MYHYNYENLEKAKSAFQRLPEVDGRSLTQIDYSEAERRCPHHMPIALLMRGAAELFA
jgi:hypothetical protein